MISRDVLFNILHQAEVLNQAKKENKLIITDYPYIPKSRNWKKSQGVKKLINLFELNEKEYKEIIKSFLNFENYYTEIPIHPNLNKPSLPNWDNGWIDAFDSMSIYSFLALNNPRYYIEIGSGHSTKFARKAINDHKLATKIVSIDPAPRTEINEIVDELIRKPLEEIDLNLFKNLTSNDILFIDNSHRAFPGSDVTIFFTEILGNLPQGLTFGLHDIFLPYDYCSSWNYRYYNEQYLLFCYLLGGADRDTILLPIYYVSKLPKYKNILNKLWNNPALLGAPPNGGLFWMQKS